MIWVLLYLAIGIALAWDSVRSYGSVAGDGWAEALGDLTGFLVILLLWLPIIGFVTARLVKRAVWPR